MRKTCYLTLSMILLHAAQLHAGLVLDDFDDPAETVSPEMLNETVTTENVGPFDARRELRIFGSQARPVGSLQSAVDGSLLVGELTELNPTSNAQRPIWAINHFYNFDGADFSTGGANDALFVDFKSFQSALTPRFSRILVKDDIVTNSYESLRQTILPSDEPFTLVFPFDSFHIRGGGGGAPDFSEITWLSWTISFQSNGSQNDLGFLMEVDRIRVGKIPEPGSNILVLIGLTTACLYRIRRFRFMTWFHRKENRYENPIVSRP